MDPFNNLLSLFAGEVGDVMGIVNGSFPCDETLVSRGKMDETKTTQRGQHGATSNEHDGPQDARHERVRMPFRMPFRGLSTSEVLRGPLRSS
jgi:hypothetical protein